MNNTKFGVEIEVIGCTAEELSYYLWKNYSALVYSRHRKVKVFGLDWGITQDNSIKFNNAAGGCEVITPILTIQDLPILAQMLEAIKVAGCKTNESCTIHVHVDGSALDADALVRLQKEFMNNQQAIYNRFGVADPRKSGRYAKFFPKRYIEKVNNLTPGVSMEEVKELLYENLGRGKTPTGKIKINPARTYGINLHTFFNLHGTVEFRFFNGTLDMEKIQEYIEFCLNFCRSALNTECLDSPNISVSGQDGLYSHLLEQE